MNIKSIPCESEKIVYRHLLRLGVPTEMRGYKYLKTAIMLCLQNEEYIYATTKMLYPMVAKKYMTAPTSVERNIRTAVEHVCKNTSQEVLRKYFGNVWNTQKDKLTNRKFIGGLVEYIKMEVVK